MRKEKTLQTVEEETEGERPQVGGKRPKAFLNMEEMRNASRTYYVERLFSDEEPCEWTSDAETIPPSTPRNDLSSSRKRKAADEVCPVNSAADSGVAAVEVCPVNSAADSCVAAVEVCPVNSEPATAVEDNGCLVTPGTPSKHNGWVLSPNKGGMGAKKQRKLGPLFAKAARAANHKAAQYQMAGRSLQKAKSSK